VIEEGLHAPPHEHPPANGPEAAKSRTALEHCEESAARRGRGPAATFERLEDREVVPWLRALGYRAGQARHAAERCEVIRHAPPVERVRFALSCLAPRAIRRRPAGP
jgi:hypothetical protein